MYALAIRILTVFISTRSIFKTTSCRNVYTVKKTCAIIICMTNILAGRGRKQSGADYV